jgi:DNA-binding HxlR family transcriptional regulator
MPATKNLISRFNGFLSSGADSRQCPVRDVLDRLGDKWSALMVIALATARPTDDAD